MKKALLMLAAVAAFGVAACGPGGGSNASGAPQITGPLTTGDPGSSLPLGSPGSEESHDAMSTPGEMDDQMDDDVNPDDSSTDVDGGDDDS